ncbi:hypothetical protein SDC9_143677 [bioreactor metagenome]|uniref:Uncharacterized protein n=1 Tax=bioreactor metagenome TaxID=1076179 RepID=A0A645E6T1_9ZZZZ
MTRDRKWLLPRPHRRADSFDHDRRAEDGAVKDGPDRPVGALPLLLEAVFLDPLGVGGDRGALYGDAVFLGRLGGFDRYFIVGLVAVLQSEVIILRLEVDEGQDQSILDLLPENARHLVPVHLD